MQAQEDQHGDEAMQKNICIVAEEVRDTIGVGRSLAGKSTTIGLDATLSSA